MTSRTPMIEIKGLSKTFYTPDPVRAVQQVSLQCHAGEIFGLLGPNGAGKTTLLRMVSTLLKPDSGVARIADFGLACVAPRGSAECLTERPRIEVALRRLPAFQFVGLTEQYALSICLFHATVGGPCLPVEFQTLRPPKPGQDRGRG